MEDDSTKKETSLPGWTRLRNEQLEWHPKVSLLLVPHSPAGRVQTRKGRWGQWKWQTLPTPRVWERGEERNETSMRAEEKLLSNRKTALLNLYLLLILHVYVCDLCVHIQLGLFLNLAPIAANSNWAKIEEATHVLQSWKDGQYFSHQKNPPAPTLLPFQRTEEVRIQNNRFRPTLLKC